MEDVLRDIHLQEVESGYKMQCIKPVLIRAKAPVKWGSRLEDGMLVPCGKCVMCKIARAREWSTRILHECAYHEDNIFLTLTYNDEHLPKSISKKELQNFFKRLRKSLGDRKIKYYACGEYGEESQRPHYHAIIHGISGKPVHKLLIEKAWQGKGYIKIGTVTKDSARYVAQYVDKKYNGKIKDEVYTSKGLECPFQLQSQGIGKQFAIDNQYQIKEFKKVTIDGVNVGVPRYYKKMLELDFTEEAIQQEKESILFHMSKRNVKTEYDYLVSMKKAREQAEKNAEARKNLKNRAKI